MEKLKCLFGGLGGCLWVVTVCFVVVFEERLFMSLIDGCGLVFLWRGSTFKNGYR